MIISHKQINAYTVLSSHQRTMQYWGSLFDQMRIDTKYNKYAEVTHNGQKFESQVQSVSSPDIV